MSKVKWGIISAGRISNDIVNAITDPTGPAAELCEIVAVAARDLDRAKTFAEIHSIPKAFGDYKAIADHAEIDVAYVGNTMGQRYDVVKMMLNANKHVVGETGLTSTSEKVEELYELAQSKNLFLIEALWTNFFPTYKKIQEVIRSGVIGEVVHVDTTFGLEVLEKSEAQKGGGPGLELGLYCINLIRLAFQNEEPKEIVVRGDLFDSGIDSSWDAILVFSDNRRAVIKCSARHNLHNSAHITGSKGAIQVPEPMWCPTEIIINGEKFTCQLPSSKPVTNYNYPNSSGLAFEVAAICQAIDKRQIECEEYTETDCVYVHKILDEILRQLNYKPTSI